MQLRKIIDGVDGNTDYQQVTRIFIHGSFYFLFTVKLVVHGKTFEISVGVLRFFVRVLKFFVRLLKLFVGLLKLFVGLLRIFVGVAPNCNVKNSILSVGRDEYWGIKWISTKKVSLI